MSPPPRWVRRVVLAPGMVLAAAVVLAALPLWALVALVASPVLPGRWRPLRVGWVVTVHLVLEAVLLCAMLVAWIASGFGLALHRPAFERAHYALMRFYLRALFAQARWALRVQVRVEGPDPARFPGRPLIVLSRHAGPGDSFLLAHALVNWYDREPRFVVRDALQWDPAIDVLLNRLPNRFVSPQGDSGDALERWVGALATGLDHDDAFVIFPEGGNFTARRRARAIARLRERGLVAQAQQAERLRYVLPLRPGGTLAALTAAADADVVWVAHTGTDTLFTVADVWRALPLDRGIEMRWWHVVRAEVPEDDAERIAWLNGWWTRVDDWIAERRDASAG